MTSILDIVFVTGMSSWICLVDSSVCKRGAQEVGQI